MCRSIWYLPRAICMVAVLLSVSVRAETAVLKLRVSGNDVEHQQVPLRVSLPAALKEARSAVVSDSAGREFAAQVTGPSLLGGSTAELHFILPSLQAGEQLDLTATLSDKPTPGQAAFHWSDSADKYSELSFADRPVLRYMYEALDDSTPERRGETYKVYHHVYDPQGKRLVTKGPGGLFPHHRGLYYGFNRISYGDGKKADVWHCNRGESQAHAEFLATEAGPVLGRHRLAIDWCGQDGQVFAREERELTAYNTQTGTLIEFASRLKSEVGEVKLDGDPQHAGFQFRAAQQVADVTKQQTYYLRPDGKDKPGSFRNWPGNKEHVNLAWNALSFVLDKQRYTCGYLDRPENPKESRFSERDYGRFGSYFEYSLTAEQPLELNYRIWLQEGEMTVDQVHAHSHNLVKAPVVTLVD